MGNLATVYSGKNQSGANYAITTPGGYNFGYTGTTGQTGANGPTGSNGTISFTNVASPENFSSLVIKSLKGNGTLNVQVFSDYFGAGSTQTYTVTPHGSDQPVNNIPFVGKSIIVKNTSPLNFQTSSSLNWLWILVIIVLVILIIWYLTKNKKY